MGTRPWGRPGKAGVPASVSSGKPDIRIPTCGAWFSNTARSRPWPPGGRPLMSRCLVSALPPPPFRRRQGPGRLQQEEVCVQAALHLPAGPRHRLRAHGGREPAQLQQIHREADRECAGRGILLIRWPLSVLLFLCTFHLVWGFPVGSSGSCTKPLFDARGAVSHGSALEGREEHFLSALLTRVTDEFTQWPLRPLPVSEPGPTPTWFKKPSAGGGPRLAPSWPSAWALPTPGFVIVALHSLGVTLFVCFLECYKITFSSCPKI